MKKIYFSSMVIPHLVILTCKLAVSSNPYEALPENFILSQNTCGGVLEGLVGLVNYKLGEQLNPGIGAENCIWTVRAGLKGIIQLQLLDDGFESTNPSIHISTANISTRFHSTHVTTLKKGDRTPFNVSGPLIYVQFVGRPDLLNGGTGFSLLFRGIGEDISGPVGGSNVTYSYVLQHDHSPNGSIHVPLIPGQGLNNYEIFSLTLYPEEDKALAVTIVAPMSFGYSPNHSYFRFGCGWAGGRIVVMEHAYWAGGGTLRLTICRSEPTYNSSVVSLHPLVLTFYSDESRSKEGFGVTWESVIRN